MSKDTSLWNSYLQPFFFIIGVLGVLWAGVFSMSTQFRPSPEFTYSLNGLLTFWFFSLLGFLVALFLISSISDSTLILLFVIFLYSFCGVMIGYKGVPALLHRYAEQSDFETRIITTRQFRGTGRNRIGCRYKLVVSEKDGDQRVGDSICVTESIYRHANKGDVYQVFGIESKYGWKVTHSSRIQQ